VNVAVVSPERGNTCPELTAARIGISQPMSSRPAMSSGVRFLRLPSTTSGSIAGSSPPTKVSDSQWPSSSLIGGMLPGPS
jgi:hypothetical protein